MIEMESEVRLGRNISKSLTWILRRLGLVTACAQYNFWLDFVRFAPVFAERYHVLQRLSYIE